jgi:hypothetical protein
MYKIQNNCGNDKYSKTCIQGKTNVIKFKLSQNLVQKLNIIWVSPYQMQCILFLFKLFYSLMTICKVLILCFLHFTYNIIMHIFFPNTFCRYLFSKIILVIMFVIMNDQSPLVGWIHPFGWNWCISDPTSISPPCRMNDGVWTRNIFSFYS